MGMQRLECNAGSVLEACAHMRVRHRHCRGPWLILPGVRVHDKAPSGQASGSRDSIGSRGCCRPVQESLMARCSSKQHAQAFRSTYMSAMGQILDPSRLISAYVRSCRAVTCTGQQMAALQQRASGDPQHHLLHCMCAKRGLAKKAISWQAASA